MNPSHMRRLFGTVGLAVAFIMFAGQDEPARAADGPDKVGAWGKKLTFQNVPIHTHVLPDGRVLYWGRREKHEGLNPHNCTPRIWDPILKTDTPVAKPGFNLFCSGHTFLGDGRLFVAGGHFFDGQGVAQATIFDHKTESWTRVPKDMSGGRWYPTAITLADGNALVSFGKDALGHDNLSQQIWKDNPAAPWTDTVPFTFEQGVPPYYPRMHVVGDGRVFMSGPLPLTQFLDTTAKSWTFLHPDPDINTAVRLSSRVSGKSREYATSVLYDEGKILFVGGGNQPSKAVESLDLTSANPAWKSVDDMHFPRRQHNATLLPDGTVLVTGGTQGAGGETNGFNDLTPGAPIHSADLWNPKAAPGMQWTKMAKEEIDRCYHSTAVLLPDATVLSAGGGEYSPKNDGAENAAVDTHRSGQIFSPPYLFRGGVRPMITKAPPEVEYDKPFEVETPNPGDVGAVNWVRLSSVTHSLNSNQRINFLTFNANATSLTVTTPKKRELCPPGHYMLFVLNKAGVPSVAKIIRIR